MNYSRLDAVCFLCCVIHLYIDTFSVTPKNERMQKYAKKRNILVFCPCCCSTIIFFLKVSQLFKA